MEKMYMIEVLVTKIVFAELPVPLKRDIIITVTTGNLASLEIRTDVMGVLANLETKERSSKNKNFDIDCGRSVVFPIQPTILKDALQKIPLEVSVTTKNDETSLGSATIPWNMDFTDMVQSSEQSSGYITPVYIEGSFAMTKGNNEFGGTIDMFIRLSFLGRNVYTNIQRMLNKENAGAPGGEPTTYLFKSADNATIFKCARHGIGSDTEVMPIGAIYGITNRIGDGGAGMPFAPMGGSKSKSTETLLKMKQQGGSGVSLCPSAFRTIGTHDRQALYNNMADSIMSLMSVGPLKGKKLFDLTELHMDVSTFSTLANALGLHMFSYGDSSEGEGEDGGELRFDYKALTVAEIEKRLCKHPDCPAAKLFKDYGIGPLAKNINGVGGLYKDVDPPCTYGLSHCNGTIEDYGPLGRFKRPKKVEEPFIPQSDCKCGKKNSSTSLVSKSSNANKKSSCYQHCPMINKKQSTPLRLRGGSPVGPECQPLPNPLTLCQDLNHDLSKILKEYIDPKMTNSGKRTSEQLTTLPKNKQSKPLRLRGGAPNGPEESPLSNQLPLRQHMIYVNNEYKNGKTCSDNQYYLKNNNKLSPPLRLRGGTPLGPACNPLPNPLTLCQDLMDDFNKVLKEYKDALGPCGQATCPFALNVIGEACQDVCNSSDPEKMRNICDLTNTEAVLEEKDDFTGCGVPDCPYKRAAISPAEKDYSKYKGMPGCGYTNCPFVRAKLGMEEEEDKHLPPFKDYQKQETYKFSDKLPPIHWDCPDPLPQGDCKNPDCPYVKRDALIKKYFPDPCCPCGSPVCPYVCAPCTFPGCPFGIAEPCPPVCPYTGPPPKELKCTPSVCPFARVTEEKCQSAECPYRLYEERLELCAKEMEEERLRAEEEEEVPCRPCGRSKWPKSGDTSGSSRKLSTTKTSFTNRSGTNFSSSNVNPERASEPCILSATAYKKDHENICQPGTCGRDLICSVCNTDDQKKEKKAISKDVARKRTSSVSFNSSSSTTNPYGKDIKKNFLASDKQFSKTDEASSSKKSSLRHIIDKMDEVHKTEQKKEVSMDVQPPPAPVVLGKESKPPGLCRKSPFRFDKKSFKPCNKIGHRECVLPKFMVPKDMGWLWNVHTAVCGLRPRRGWKPGAISKTLALRMDYFNAMREKRPWRSKSKTKYEELITKNSKPTISINKKDGVVNVTMLPIKDPAEVRKQGDGNPYMDCTPIKFKITKNDPEKEKKYCFCGDELSNSSGSELDIEFSPPAAMKNPRLICRVALLEQEAQYNINDVPIPPPPPPKKKKGKGSKKGKKKKK